MSLSAKKEKSEILANRVWLGILFGLISEASTLKALGTSYTITR